MWTKHSISGAAGQSILWASTAHPQKRTAVNSALRSSSTHFLDLGQCFPTAGRDPAWAGVKTGFAWGHKVLEKAKEIFKLKDFCSVFSQLGGWGGEEWSCTQTDDPRRLIVSEILTWSIGNSTLERNKMVLWLMCRGNPLSMHFFLIFFFSSFLNMLVWNFPEVWKGFSNLKRQTSKQIQETSAWAS